MANVLVLGGAGNVGAPCVRYLLGKGHNVTLGDINLEAARGVVGSHPNGFAKEVNADKEDPAFKAAINASDLVISFLPAFLHDEAAVLAIAAGTHFITASYPSEFLESCGSLAAEFGSIVVPEMGVDPGFDLMSAQKIIDDLHSRGYKITHFTSYCGGLLDPSLFEAHPLGQASAWAPEAGLSAMTNDAMYLEDGEVVRIPNSQLFDNLSEHTIEVDGELMRLLGYPNRDSIRYIDQHGLDREHLKKIIRGTLRYEKWMPIAKKLLQTEMLSREAVSLHRGDTFSDFMQRYQGVNEAGLRHLFGHQGVYAALRKVGFFDKKPIPELKYSSPFGITLALLNDWMLVKPDQRDIIVMQHIIKGEIPGSVPEKTTHVTDTFVHFGKVGGDTAMAETVALPAAVLADLVLKKEIDLSPGLHRPTSPAIYQAVLPAFGKAMGIMME